VFIKERQIQLPDEVLQEAIFVRCQFNANQYSDTLFEEYGIAFHQSLSKAVPKRRAEFLAGRYCAQQALIRLGFNHTHVDIGKNRNPIWPEGVVGSISHDNDSATAIVKHKVTAYSSVGIDVEKWIGENDVQSMWEVIVADDEYRLLSDSFLPLNQILTIIFSAKECFFKAVYKLVGQYFGFEEAKVTEIYHAPTSGRVKLTISECLKKALTHRHEYDIHYFVEQNRVLTICNL
jgi:enterobactin synthetase component D